MAGYRGIVHGEAVAMGMHAAATLACTLGLCSADMVSRQKALIEAAGLATKFPDLPADKVVEAFFHDKKKAGARLKFVLPRALGKVEIVADPDPAALRAAIEASKH
jgi:3-dehydroquinate synthase